MRTYKARGIVLHTLKYGDSGAVAYLLTDLLGRVNYMIPGVRSKRGHGNKGALLQPMFLVEFEGYTPPKGEMHRMRELKALVPLTSISSDVRKGTIALFMAEMLYRLVREVEPNSPLFEFVLGTVLGLEGAGAAGEGFDGMGQGGGQSIANYHLWFMVGLSRFLGFYPGNEWAAGHWFDIREGIFTPVMPLHGMFFTRENAAILGRLMAMETGDLAALPLNRGQRVEFLNSMLGYFGYHLDAVRDVRSVEILREVFF